MTFYKKQNQSKTKPSIQIFKRMSRQGGFAEIAGRKLFFDD
jgi:hypothetical protein